MNVYSMRPGEWSTISPFGTVDYEGTPGPTLYFTYRHWVEDDGLWAPCVRSVEDEITVQTNPPDAVKSVPPVEIAKARRMFVQQALRDWTLDVEFAERLTAGDQAARTILWMGVAHNAATVGSSVVFAVSLGWIGEWLRNRRKRRQLAAGRCPTCGYSLAGLVGTICPECGKSAFCGVL